MRRGSADADDAGGTHAARDDGQLVEWLRARDEAAFEALFVSVGTGGSATSDVEGWRAPPRLRVVSCWYSGDILRIDYSFSRSAS